MKNTRYPVGYSSFSASETSVACRGASSAQFSGTAQKYRDEKRAGKYALGCYGFCIKKGRDCFLPVSSIHLKIYELEKRDVSNGGAIKTAFFLRGAKNKNAEA